MLFNKEGSRLSAARINTVSHRKRVDGEVYDVVNARLRTNDTPVYRTLQLLILSREIQ